MDVTVVVLTYDSAATIDACLRSLAAQTLPPAEIVIVDDDSTDTTLARVADFAAAVVTPVRIVRNGSHNISRGRNLGIAAARTPLVAFLDSDACAEPGWIAGARHAFGAAPDAAVVGGGVVTAHATDVRRRHRGQRRRGPRPGRVAAPCSSAAATWPCTATASVRTGSTSGGCTPRTSSTSTGSAGGRSHRLRGCRTRAGPRRADTSGRCTGTGSGRCATASTPATSAWSTTRRRSRWSPPCWPRSLASPWLLLAYPALSVAETLFVTAYRRPATRLVPLMLVGWLVKNTGWGLGVLVGIAQQAARRSGIPRGDRELEPVA